MFIPVNMFFYLSCEGSWMDVMITAVYVFICFSVVSVGRGFICYLLYMWEENLFVICVLHTVATQCCAFLNVCCTETNLTV
jgi:hypothetical protein